MSDSEIKVHPAAAVFPMLSDDELADLAEDIKANGLLHPIVRDAEGQIIDGRNRYAACGIAGIEPTFTTVNGHDPIALILSANVHRRHMSKGQRAMAAARVRLVANRSMRDVAEDAGTSKAWVVKAAVVLDYAPDLAELVLSGTMYLEEAYAKARERKLAQEDQEKADARALAEATAQTAKLREQAPDLAELVAEWRLSLNDAMAALEKRQQEERERKQRATLGFARATSYLHALLQADPERIAGDWLQSENTLSTIAGCEHLWTSDGLRELADWLARAASAWEDERR